MLSRTALLLASALLALPTACTSNPPPATAAAAGDTPSLAGCCDQLGRLHRQTDMQQTEDVVRSPDEQAALQERLASSRAAHESCKAELDSPGHGGADWPAKVKASAGKLDLAKLAPACVP